MKSLKYILLICIAFSFVACKKEQNPKKDFEIQHLSHDEMKSSSKLDVVVVNDLDPICGMKTEEHLSDTATYKGNVYGFCSTMCKEAFLKEPDKYIHE